MLNLKYILDILDTIKYFEEELGEPKTTGLQHLLWYFKLSKEDKKLYNEVYDRIDGIAQLHM